MPAVGKEIERLLTSPETTLPVEQIGYVEKVEKQTEIQQPASVIPQRPKIQDVQGGDMGEIVSAQFASQTKPSIVLPLNDREVIEGLHKGVWESVRWLAEWCVMMIKKYPGRVFYLPPETR